ncbi:MAG: hypothetical protein ACHQD8_07575 [Chitinophagales bacterium]
MKKTLLFFALLLLVSSFQSFGQDKNRIPVVIKLGKIETPEVIEGKVVPVYTTRTEILKNAWLVSTASNCEITSYTFSIKAEGHTLTGPFEIKGSAFPEKIKTKIRDWDYPGTQIMIKNIHVTCGGNDHIAYPLFLNYDH